MIPTAPGSEFAVRIIDPDNPAATTGILTIDARGAASVRPAETSDRRQPIACISPGWVDLHAHVYDGTT
ncbi:MAG: hypothetical protein JWQ64_232, partial [Subtercola sp.]|nr:hypothetical protein [Subtercola sp.]